METGMVINQISNRLRRRSQAVQKSVGISESQGRVLNFIIVESRLRDVYPRDIEEEFDLRSSTVTGIVSDLEKEGLIKRIADKKDGRLKKLIITDKAENIIDALQEEIEETERLLLTGISKEEKAIFLDIARRMLKNI